jgi:uncharacterized protein YecT (DUF1311 family)
MRRILKIFFCLMATAALARDALAQNAAPPPDCAAATTQAGMTECAYEDLLSATADYSASYKAVSGKLASRPQHDQLRRTQRLWIEYRTAACKFESSSAKGGSVQGMVNWQCAARMTRARTAELVKLASCPEGDVSCPRLVK